MAEDPRAGGVTGIVLAGGRSTRMGRPKALLPLGGEPLVARVVARLRAIADDVVIVAAPGQELPALAARVVRDEVPHCGPMGGIRHGLAAARSRLCFVASCDLPFLDPALVTHLIARAATFDVVVPRWQQRLQPLHAVYRASMTPLFEEALARGTRRPVAVFESVRTCVIEEDEVCRFDPEGWSFFNVNTTEEYGRAVDRLARSLADDAARVTGGDREEAQRMHCTVELFGVARLLARTAAVDVSVRVGANVSDVLAALAEKHPRLVGRVIDTARQALTNGYACNVNGAAFIRSPRTPIASGDSILILSADAGG